MPGRSLCLLLLEPIKLYLSTSDMHRMCTTTLLKYLNHIRHIEYFQDLEGKEVLQYVS